MNLKTPGLAILHTDVPCAICSSVSASVIDMPQKSEVLIYQAIVFVPVAVEILL